MFFIKKRHILLIKNLNFYIIQIKTYALAYKEE
jgi:hypothetical protein